MRTKEYVMVNEDSYPNGVNVVMTVIITTLLCTGFSAMFATAYEFGNGIWSFVFIALVASTVFSLLYYPCKKKLTAAVLIATPLLIALAVYWDLFNTQKGLNALLYNLQRYAFFFLPDIFEGGSSADGVYITAFLNAYNIAAISFMTHALMRRKNIPWALLFFVPLFVFAVENTSMLPHAVSCIVAAAGVLLAVLAHAMRNKEIGASGKMLMILAVPVLLFSILIGVIFPAKDYDKDELASDFLTYGKELAENISSSLSEKFDVIINGINNPNLGKDNNFLFSLAPSPTNLRNVGPFDPVEEPVFRIHKMYNADYSGPINPNNPTAMYLKIESLDEYKDNMLRSSKIKGKVYKNGAEPDPVEAPFKVKIEPLDNKWVDISPYYTDFYVAGNKKYQTVNAFNTTKDGASTYAYCPVPVKTGNIYSDEYIEDYVYGTNLKVPKSTEMALISSGALPDWYLDVYHGYVTMSDAEKVRRVTDYVCSLHPYSKETDYPPKDVDFVVWFITDAETGICVHYAATTVVLLRLIGVPARYVRGYVDSVTHADTEYYIYSTQAHAWFEFFEPEYGWILGDSTPGAYMNAADFNINGVARQYPEIEQAQYARGYTSIFNPDYTSTTTTTETTEETTSDTEETSGSDTEPTTGTTTETTPETTLETEPGDTPTPADQTEPSDAVTASSETMPSGQTPSGTPDNNITPSIVISGDTFGPGTNIYMSPDGEIHVALEENKLLAAIGNTLLTISLIALLADLLLIGWTVYWRRQFAKKDPVRRAISGYHYFSFMSRIFKYALPKRARLIAEKAAFSQDKITLRESEALITICVRDMTEIAKGFNRFKKFLFAALAVKIRNKKPSL